MTFDINKEIKMSNKSKVAPTKPKSKIKNPKVLPTKKQIAAIKRAVAFAGSKGNLAKGIDVTPSSISHWCSGLNCVTPNNAKKIEEFTRGEVRADELARLLLKEDEGAELDVYR